MEPEVLKVKVNRKEDRRKISSVMTKSRYRTMAVLNQCGRTLPPWGHVNVCRDITDSHDELALLVSNGLRTELLINIP